MANKVISPPSPSPTCCHMQTVSLVTPHLDQGKGSREDCRRHHTQPAGCSGAPAQQPPDSDLHTYICATRERERREDEVAGVTAREVMYQLDG